MNTETETVKVRLLVGHPYRGAKGSVIECSAKDAAGFIRNGIAEALGATEKSPLEKAPLVEKNKRLSESKVRKSTIVSDFN